MVPAYRLPSRLLPLLWMGAFSVPAFAAPRLPPVTLAGHELPLAGPRSGFLAESAGLPCQVATVDGRQGRSCTNKQVGDAEVRVEVAFAEEVITYASVYQAVCDESTFPSASLDALVAALGTPTADSTTPETYTRVRTFASGHVVEQGGEVDCRFVLRSPTTVPAPATQGWSRYPPGVYPRGTPMFLQLLEIARGWCSKSATTGREHCGLAVSAMATYRPPAGEKLDANGQKVTCAQVEIREDGATMVSDCGEAPTIEFVFVGKELSVKSAWVKTVVEPGTYTMASIAFAQASEALRQHCASGSAGTGGCAPFRAALASAGPGCPKLTIRDATAELTTHCDPYSPSATFAVTPSGFTVSDISVPEDNTGGR